MGNRRYTDAKAGQEASRRHRLISMPLKQRGRRDCGKRAISALLLAFCATFATGQEQPARAPLGSAVRVVITVVDENGLAVQGAQVTVIEPGQPPAQLWTDYDGHCSFVLRQSAPFQIRSGKPGFIRTLRTELNLAWAASGLC